MPPAEDFSWFRELADLGGWVAFLVVVILGGRAFLTVAREFAGDVVQELREIKAELGQQREALVTLGERMENHSQQLDRIERHLP